MKLKFIAIIGLALAVVGGAFYLEIGSDPKTKTGRNLQSAAQQMSQLEASEARAYVDAGLANMKNNDSKAAEDAFRKALEIDPKYNHARVALANLYLAIGNQERGEQELMLAAKSDPENEELLHMLGASDFETRRLDEYENLYKDLLKAKPDSLAIKKKLTEIRITKGEFREARSYVGQIWTSQPGDTDALYLDGRIYLAEKDYVRATEKLFLVTQQAPWFAPGYYFLGLARLGTNNIREAKMAFLRAKELFPVWIKPRIALARSYLATGDYDVALEEIAPILQAQPGNFDILMIAGVARLKTGKVEQALDLFHRAKNLVPTDAYPRINIGAAYVVQKKYGQALTEYEEALKLDPDRIDALGSLTQLLAVQRTHKAVIARVEQHLAKTKNKAEVYELLGQLSMNQQDYETALSFLGKAVALNPDLFSASFLIASTYMAQKKFDQAIKESEKIIQKNPKAIQAYMLLGNLHDVKQQHDEANRHYRKVLELDKASTTAANNLAWNYAQYGGNLDVAFSLAQKARELNPNDESIADTLGWIYYKKGAYLTAIGLLKESSEKFKDRNPTVLYHLGMAYRKNGDNTLAKESFLKALKLDQNSRETEAAKRALDEIGDRTG